MATATVPVAGDLVAVDANPTTASPTPPGLYLVLNATTPYAVADPSSPNSIVGHVPQARLLAVWHAS